MPPRRGDAAAASLKQRPKVEHGRTDHQDRPRRADLSRRRYGRARAARRQPLRRGRRIRRHHGLVGLGQVDADGGARLSRPAEQRPLFFRRHRRRGLKRARARAAAQRTAWLRVPELQSALAHQRDRERGAAAVLRRLRPGQRDLARGAGARGAQAARPRRPRAKHARPTVGRPAATRRHRPRADQRARPAARRRADRQPRHPHLARDHADADAAQPRTGRHHHRRHP